MSNLLEFSQNFVNLYNKGDFETIYKDLYSPSITSIEADGNTAEGMAGIEAKNEWWSSTFETHASEAVGPFPHGDDLFAVVFKHDTTHRESGHRTQMEEVALYTVANGKIVKEQFCYASGGEG